MLIFALIFVYLRDKLLRETHISYLFVVKAYPAGDHHFL